MSSFNENNRLINQKVTASFTQKPTDCFNTRITGPQQLQRSTAFNTRVSDNRNMPELAPVLHGHRGSLPTEKLPIGFNPLTNAGETAL